MKKTRLTTLTLSLALAATLAFAGMAAARSHYYMGGPGSALTVEQVTAMQELHQQFFQKMQPLMQLQWAKQAELDALYTAGAKDDDYGGMMGPGYGPYDDAR